jgi:preprotein translocase subunit SecF
LITGSGAIVWLKGMNKGIDFAGGVLMEIRTVQPADLATIRTMLSSAISTEITLQQAISENKTGSDLLIRIGSPDKKSGISESSLVQEVKTTLAKALPNQQIDYRKIDYVGPQVGQELIKQGILAVLFSFVAIMVYVWFRFEWQYGVGVLAALIHDAILTVGFMSVIGLEFNLTSIAALLTIIGYSVNDSIVIYDRIRTNLIRHKKMPIDEILNKSLNETLSRTLLTVTTTFLATLALVLFAGEAVHSFSVAMLFGIIIGTYSSIYISAPILIYFRLRPQLTTNNMTAKGT